MSDYIELVKHYHKPNSQNKCPWCSETFPCTVYREVVGDGA